MKTVVSLERLRFILNRLRERLWVKPLAMCVLSIGAAFVATLFDDAVAEQFVPDISQESIETLLSVMASSMLVIATFSVTSMVSAYASASSTATPRSFTLIVADDSSQNALSTFVGAFIFSIVAITAAKNAYFDKSGLFVLFVITAAVFAMVIVKFVTWVDSIARLGLVGSTIEKVEKATAAALERRRLAPSLCGVPRGDGPAEGRPVYASSIGYVQQVDMAALSAWAEAEDARVVVDALPGTFASPDRVLAYVRRAGTERPGGDDSGLVSAFQIGGDRLYEDDPRFGLCVLAEIAGRALSPAVNDPGTAISVVSRLLRLLTDWSQPVDEAMLFNAIQFDRIEVPTITTRDMFDDAFTAIARDGAGTVEVCVRLQKALRSLAASDNAETRDAARYHARLALERAEHALRLAADLEAVRGASVASD